MADAWWTVELPGIVDPISLELISSLPYPPFELRADPQASAENDWFDGKELAKYLVSSLRFAHPISRRVLLRDECVALDAYLQRWRISKGVASVVHVFDRTEANVGEAGAAVHISRSSTDSQRADVAASLAAALYETARATPDTHPRPQRAVYNNGRTRAGRAAAAEARAVRRDGNMVMIDDDQLPTHARSGAAATGYVRPAGSVITAADFGDWAGRAVTNAAAAPSRVIESFPALPTPTPRPVSSRSSGVPPEVTAALAARAAAREAAQAAAAAEEVRTIERAAEMRRSERREIRSVLVALALSGELMDEASSAQLLQISSDAERLFTAEARALAVTQPGLIASIEKAFDLLIAGNERRRALPPMPRQQRRVTHEMSHVYNVGTIAQGTEPQRFINLLRTDATAWPEVECSERSLTQLIGSHKEEYALRWEPERKRDRQSAREAMQLTAILTFSTESAARALLRTVGGGFRGKFRVDRPAWIAGGVTGAAAHEQQQQQQATAQSVMSNGAAVMVMRAPPPVRALLTAQTVGDAAVVLRLELLARSDKGPASAGTAVAAAGQGAPPPRSARQRAQLELQPAGAASSAAKPKPNAKAASNAGAGGAGGGRRRNMFDLLDGIDD